MQIKKTALQWIKNCDFWVIFVYYRIDEIHKLTQVFD